MAAARDAQPVAPWTVSERAALWEVNRAAGEHVAVKRNIEALGNPATLAVVAGQQAGLFLTPLYILYKALAAVRWAGRLADLLERPVVPVFWVASDDHDFEEVRNTVYLNSEGRCKSWTYTPPGFDPAGRSVFDIPAAPEVLETFFALLDTDTHDSEFKKSQIHFWRTLACESRTLEDFFLRGLAHLCGPMGLVLLPARLVPVRQRAMPLMEREICHPEALSQRLAEVGKLVEGSGRGKAPIHRSGNEANFFLYRAGRRCKVTVEEERFRIHTPASPVLVGADDLLEELRQTPEHFSPNVVTRPVVQDSVLPTLAMVAGPGEVRYLTQLADAGTHDFYSAFGCAVLSRPRVVLVEPRIERLLEKRGIPFELLEREAWNEVEARLADGEQPESVNQALMDLTNDAQAALVRLRTRLGDLANRPSVGTAFEKTERAWLQAASRLEERVRQELRQATGTGADQRERVLEALRPGGLPQERVFGPLAPFLIQYGPDLIPWILNKLDLDRNDLQVLRLEEFLKNKNHSEKDGD
jgi:bacillithiol biosynthesis cysteine-adding enzyme BshC